MIVATSSWSKNDASLSPYPTLLVYPSLTKLALQTFHYVSSNANPFSSPLCQSFFLQSHTCYK